MLCAVTVQPLFLSSLIFCFRSLREVLEMADDLEVDIPKLWDFFAEILNPLFVCECLSLNDYFILLAEVGIDYKAPRGLAR